MPSERTLSIFSGLAQGLEKAATNLQNISTKKEELRVEKEKYALDKKIKDAQLKKLEFETSPEAVAEHREKFKQANQLHELNMKVKSSQINTAEINERKKEQDLRKEGELRIMAGVGTLQDLGMSEDQARSTMGSLFTPQTVTTDEDQAQETDPFMRELGSAARARTGITQTQAANKLYGITTGGAQAKPRIPTQSGMQTTAVVDGQIVPTKPYYKEKASFVTPKADHIRELKGLVNKGAGNKDIEDYLAIRGYDWEDFERLGILQKRQAGSDFSRSDFLPKNIKKTSEAVEYIMREHGKTKKEAIELLKEQQGQ